MAKADGQRRATPTCEKENPTGRLFLLGTMALFLAVYAAVLVMAFGGTAQAQEGIGETASASASATASAASGTAATISAASSVPPSATASATALASSGGPSLAPALAMLALVALVASGAVTMAMLRRGAS